MAKVLYSSAMRLLLLFFFGTLCLLLTFHLTRYSIEQDRVLREQLIQEQKLQRLKEEANSLRQTNMLKRLEKRIVNLESKFTEIRSRYRYAARDDYPNSKGSPKGTGEVLERRSKERSKDNELSSHNRNRNQNEFKRAFLASKSEQDYTKNPSGPESKIHRLAVIVPFRDSNSTTSQGQGRTANLMEFAKYMNKFLKGAGRHYKIFVIEQEPGYLFNKGALFNIGFNIVKDHYDYIVLHDVDQIPLSKENDYSFPRRPTHLCTASDQYGHRQRYDTMVGGAVIMQTKHYAQVNGFSNSFWGWGLEDDSFYQRIIKAFSRNGLLKLDRHKGQYHALSHPRVEGLDSTKLYWHGRNILQEQIKGIRRAEDDGATTVKYKIIKRTVAPEGFIKYTVSLNFEFLPRTLDEVPPDS